MNYIIIKIFGDPSGKNDCRSRVLVVRQCFYGNATNKQTKSFRKLWLGQENKEDQKYKKEKTF